MQNNTVKITVPGRICLFGDKVDLLEKPVIAAAINLLMEISLEKRNDTKIVFISKNLDFSKEFFLSDI